MSLSLSETPLSLLASSASSQRPRIPPPPVAPLRLPSASLVAADAADGPLACPDRCPYGWIYTILLNYVWSGSCMCMLKLILMLNQRISSTKRL